jgi:translation initiation factor 6 (eIF-6)
LAIVLTNDTIRIAHNNFSDREEEIIADTIRTDAQHRPLDVFKLVNNSLSETMPEVIINPETGEHNKTP